MLPELPEVETIKKTLQHLVTEKTIKETDVFWGNILQRPRDPEEFKALLKGQTIHELKRRGKFLLFYLDTHVMISHLRMEGKYGVFPSGDEIAKHTHVIFRFTDGTELRYQDVRKFGTMHIYPIGEEFKGAPLDQLGPEPFDPLFTPDHLYNKLKKTSRHVKTALLDQMIVTGLGNIYVDEALHRSLIHPERKGKDITRTDAVRLHGEIVSTLQEAVEQGGTTIRSYVNTQGQIGMFQQRLKVYGRQDEACERCGNVISKTKVGGRGTHFCIQCQPE